jgi:hypothetical protein
VGLKSAVENRKILPLPGIEPRPYSPSIRRLSYPDVPEKFDENGEIGFKIERDARPYRRIRQLDVLGNMFQ